MALNIRLVARAEFNFLTLHSNLSYPTQQLEHILVQELQISSHDLTDGPQQLLDLGMIARMSQERWEEDHLNFQWSSDLIYHCFSWLLTPSPKLDAAGAALFNVATPIRSRMWCVIIVQSVIEQCSAWCFLSQQHWYLLLWYTVPFIIYVKQSSELDMGCLCAGQVHFRSSPWWPRNRTTEQLCLGQGSHRLDPMTANC